MALACPIGLDVQKLRAEIQWMYARVATDPSGEFHFHRGTDYAVRLLGYAADDLAALPPEVTASFAGVANPFVAGHPPAGATVVDVGSGAGTDSMLAATHVGPAGRVIGVDPTDEMLAKARASAAKRPELRLDFRKGSAEEIPADTASVDVVISNGVINLATDKDKAFREVLRLLRPGGRFQYADIVLGQDLSEKARSDVDLWTG